MNLSPEFDDDDGYTGMRGLVLAIIGSAVFYAVIAGSIYLYAR